MKRIIWAPRRHQRQFAPEPNHAVAVVIEAKRFESPSNWCWSAQGEWLYQTDVAVEDSTEVEPPGWLWGVHQNQAHDFVLVDALSRPASTLFPGARHNHRWRTVGYADLGATLRTAHDCGTRGLVPLLTTLWADSSHRF
jgi:hypothetical protein